MFPTLSVSGRVNITADDDGIVGVREQQARFAICGTRREWQILPALPTERALGFEQGGEKLARTGRAGER
jgi:hypothetical protein